MAASITLNILQAFPFLFTNVVTFIWLWFTSAPDTLGAIFLWLAPIVFAFLVPVIYLARAHGTTYKLVRNKDSDASNTGYLVKSTLCAVTLQQITCAITWVLVRGLGGSLPLFVKDDIMLNILTGILWMFYAVGMGLVLLGFVWATVLSWSVVMDDWAAWSAREEERKAVMPLEEVTVK